MLQYYGVTAIPGVSSVLDSFRRDHSLSRQRSRCLGSVTMHLYSSHHDCSESQRLTSHLHMGMHSVQRSPFAVYFVEHQSPASQVGRSVHRQGYNPSHTFLMRSLSNLSAPALYGQVSKQPLTMALAKANLRPKVVLYISP
ncbi:unnamed protein product, partial [Ectocarpus sp. 12 AP-2014]